MFKHWSVLYLTMVSIMFKHWSVYI